MHVALYGGSFNPPHVAHQLLSLYVLETRAVDELWWLPCFQHPFDKALESFEERARMCELAVAPLGPRVRVSDIEARLGGPSRTLRTVQALQAERPSDRFSLVIGADLEAESRTWFGADELRRLVPFIVVGRAGFGGEGGPPPMPAVSSSEVRARLARGETVDELVPASVLAHIRQRRLYGSA